MPLIELSLLFQDMTVLQSSASQETKARSILYTSSLISFSLQKHGRMEVQCIRKL